MIPRRAHVAKTRAATRDSVSCAAWGGCGIVVQLPLSEAPIVANQVEHHPYLNPGLWLAARRELGVSLSAYCGIAVGRVFGDAVLQGSGAAS
jgi:hypothetical protein